MPLVGAVVAIALLLSWGPFRRAIPSESLGAFLLVAIALVVLFQADRLS
ncbi:MAG: hypothetical protein ACM3S1_00755 [Hyphomicrobiales bacterium]